MSKELNKHILRINMSYPLGGADRLLFCAGTPYCSTLLGYVHTVTQISKFKRLMAKTQGLIAITIQVLRLLKSTSL